MTECPECGDTFASSAAMGGHRGRHTLDRQRANGYRLPTVPAPKMQREPKKRQPEDEPAPVSTVQWPTWKIERRKFDPDKVIAAQYEAERDAEIKFS